MPGFQEALMRLTRDEAGVTALEYGLIAALIAGVILSSLSALDNHLTTIFNTVSNALSR